MDHLSVIGHVTSSYCDISPDGRPSHCSATAAFGAFPNIGVPFWGVPIIEYFGACIGPPPILGNYHLKVY